MSKLMLVEDDNNLREFYWCDWSTDGHCGCNRRGCNAPGCSQLVNQAGVTNTLKLDSNPDNNMASDIDAVTAVPDLQLSQTDGVTRTAPGNALTYTLSITNAGTSGSPATGSTARHCRPA